MQELDGVFKTMDDIFKKVDGLFKEVGTIFKDTVKSKPLRLEVDRYRIVGYNDVHVENRGFGHWAVINRSDRLKGFVLNKSGEWEYEPASHSRTTEFVIRTRFKTPEAAFEAFKEWAKTK